MNITRAPWKVGRALSNGQECIVGDGDTVVALMPDATTGCTFKPDDARLIAASPVMAAYLQELADAGDARASEIMESIRAAR